MILGSASERPSVRSCLCDLEQHHAANFVGRPLWC